MDSKGQVASAFTPQKKDPVSGNDIPLGATPAEVRDNVPAMLSQGEFVIPADVLKYHGVKFFEDKIKQAKDGFQQMDNAGRLPDTSKTVSAPTQDTTQPQLPFADHELVSVSAPTHLAAGGPVTDNSWLTDYTNTNPYGTTSTGSSSGGTGIEYREFTNAKGEKIIMPYFNGMPMGELPSSYTPTIAQAPTTVGTPTSTAVQANTSIEHGDGAPDTPQKTLDSMTPEELNKLLDAKYIGDTKVGGPLMKLLDSKFFGLPSRLAKKTYDTQHAKIQAALDKQGVKPTKTQVISPPTKSSPITQTALPSISKPSVRGGGMNVASPTPVSDPMSPDIVNPGNQPYGGYMAENRGNGSHDSVGQPSQAPASPDPMSPDLAPSTSPSQGGLGQAGNDWGAFFNKGGLVKKKLSKKITARKRLVRKPKTKRATLPR